MNKTVKDEHVDVVELRVFAMLEGQLESARFCTDPVKQSQYATTAARLAETFAALRSARRGA